MNEHQRRSASVIRPVEQKDLPALKEVIDTSGLFPGDWLEGMLTAYLTDPQSEERWLTQEVGGRPMIVAFTAPERLTDGTFNLYLIAVHKDHQGGGLGSEMMRYIEELLRSEGHRILIVETSGLPEFENTRRFYDRCDYRRMAEIKDFYKEGEDKIIFWKKLKST